MVPEGGRTRTIHGFVRVRVSDVTRGGGARETPFDAPLTPR